MPVLYCVRQSSIANKEGKKLYHPQVKSTGTVTLDTMAEEVAELSSLSPGDVKNAADNLITVMTRHLQSGETVMIDGLGSFSYVMKSIGRGFETPEEVNANNCRLKVMFRPASTRNSDGTVATRSLVTGVSFKRVDTLVPGGSPTGGSSTGGTNNGIGSGGTDSGGSGNDSGGGSDSGSGSDTGSGGME